MKKENDYTYWDHLEELRRRIIFYLIILLILFIFCFFETEKILSIFKKPLTNYKIDLFYFKPYEKFFLHIKISFYSSIIISIPFLFMQFILFIIPALNKKEKIIFLIFSVFSLIVFILSLLFSYFIAIPYALSFLINFSAFDPFQNMFNVSSYFDFIFNIILATSIVFQIPLIILILLISKIIDIKVLTKNRKYILLIILIISAIFSPPDILSMLLIAIPLYFLYEMSIIIYSIFFNIKRRQSKNYKTENNY
ncbi:MAG: twin-arginine translocase subunit TatC [Spirochaetes bacterium]|nr:twin-arginine translocase subunit TatC [Spirochaetota bacterium]